MSAATSVRYRIGMRILECTRHAIIPVLWLVTLGYQFAFVLGFLGDSSQMMAWQFYRNTAFELPPIWEAVFDGFAPVALVSFSLWLAACPRALTAMFSSQERYAQAHRRLAKAVLYMAIVGTLLQAAWLLTLTFTHGTNVNVWSEIANHVTLHYEGHMPWPFLFIALAPLVAWSIVYALFREGEFAAFYRLGVGWALLLFIQANLTLALSQTRLLAHYTVADDERVLAVAKLGSITIVAVAIVVEYYQTWRAALASLQDERRLVSSPVPSP